MHWRENRGDTGELRVEVARISRVANRGQEGRGNTFVVDVVPVDVAEECMGHDFLSICGSGAQSQLRLTSEQLLENRNGVARHVNRIQGLIRKNGIVDFIFIFTTEGGLLKKHLVDEHTKCPPVNRTGVLLVQENLFHKLVNAFYHNTTADNLTYLGSHEFGSTTESASIGTVPHVLLTETIVCNLDMTIQCQKDVIKLQVTIDDAVFVEVLESQADFGGIKPVQEHVSFLFSSFPP